MNIRLCAASLVVFGAYAVPMTASQPAARQAAQRPRTLYVDSAAPPPTLQQLFATSAAVLRITVEATGAPSVEEHSRLPLAIRTQRVLVTDVLKDSTGHINAGAHIRILQYGGTVIADGQEASTEYTAPLLVVNEDAIVFLDQRRQDGAFLLSYGGVGLFAIDSTHTTVTVPTYVTKHMSDVNGAHSISVTELLATLHTFR